MLPSVLCGYFYTVSAFPSICFNAVFKFTYKQWMFIWGIQAGLESAALTHGIALCVVS